MVGIMKEYQEAYYKSLAERREPPQDSSIRIVTSQNVYNRSQITIPFIELYKYYDNTPQIALAVDTYVDLVCGTGLAFNSENDEIKTAVENWVRDTDFYSKLREITTTLLVTGNALVEVLGDYENFEEIDITTIIKKQRTQYGRIEFYEQRIDDGYSIENTRLYPNQHRIVEFNIGLSSRRAWGKSLFQTLAAPRVVGKKTFPSAIDTMHMIEGSMGQIFHSYASPTQLWYVEGASVEEINNYSNEFKNMKSGDSVFSNKKFDVDTIEVSPNTKFDGYIEHFERLLEIGTGFSASLFTGGFSARSSSETTLNLLSKKVRAVQEVLVKILLPELIEPFLRRTFSQDTIDSAYLKLAFESSNMVYLNTSDVQNAVSSGLFTRLEGRNWYRNHGVVLDDSDSSDIIDDQDATLDTGDSGEPRQSTRAGDNINRQSPPE